jgi:predicted  nucleic acid-binding Zn-ribbon protein
VTQYDDLLVVQEHDTVIDQLRHRRATLPELAELARIEEDGAALERTLTEATAARDEVARQEKRLEDEIAGLAAKIADIQSRMYSGVVTVPKELQAMQSDVDSMRRRISTLEDEELEAMTEREPLDEQVAGLEARRRQLDERGAELLGAVAEAQASIDAELALEVAARDAAAVNLPGSLTTLYEQLRTKLGGIGAARLANGRCTGCHLSLPATEVDRIRREPPDTLIRCDQCGRVLVR